MKEKKVLAGTNLAGMSTTRERINNDFYATPLSATKAILDKIRLERGSKTEPVVRWL